MARRLNDTAGVKRMLPAPEGIVPMAGEPGRGFSLSGESPSAEASVTVLQPRGAKPNPAPDGGNSLKRARDYLCRD